MAEHIWCGGVAIPPPLCKRGRLPPSASGAWLCFPGDKKMIDHLRWQNGLGQLEPRTKQELHWTYLVFFFFHFELELILV